MPKEILEYRCLLISPRDVQQERNALADSVTRWNAQIGDTLGARVELIRWEIHSAPDMSAPPQKVLNSQIVEDCDFAVAVFWYRLGTPTEDFSSGSIEEIERLRESGKRVLIYFSSQAVPQGALDIDQFKSLQEIKSKYQQEGLLGTYNDIEDLKQQFILNLTKVIAEFLTKDRSYVSQFRELQPTTLPKPDVRIKVNGGFVQMPIGKIEDILILEVQNHSPMTVFLGNVQIKLKGNKTLLPQSDAITKEFQKRRELRPGEKFSFNILPDMIINKVAIDDIICAVVSDDIDRTYESDKVSVQSILKSIVERRKTA